MIALLVVFAVIGLFFVPGARPILLWPILVVLGPMIVWRNHRFPPGAAIEPLQPDDPRLIPAARFSLKSRAVELVAAGFVDHGSWMQQMQSGSRTYLRVLTHPPSRTSATIAFVDAGAAAIPSTGLSTPIAGGRLRTSCQSRPAVAERPGTQMLILPSVAHPADLWRVHQVRLSRLPVSGAPLEPPTDRDGWTRVLNSDFQEELQRMAEHGIMRRMGRGSWVFTLRGVTHLTWNELWPRRRRIEATLRAEEERQMTALGLADLLAAARADTKSAPPHAAAERGVVALPDDRAQPRTVARESTLSGHEHRHDPRLRAIVGQAAQARRNALQRFGVWPAILVVALTILLASIGLAVGYAIAAAMAVMFVVLTIFNANAVIRGERAAAATLLRRGLCPSCLYSLRDLTPSADGCLICPECGAAWLRSRVVEFATFDAASGDDAAEARRRAATIADALTGGLSAGSRARDDRSQPCALVSPRLGPVMRAAAPGGSIRARLAKARPIIARSGRWARWGAALLIFGLFGVTLPALMLARRPFPWPPPLGLVLLFASGLFWAVMILRGNFCYRRKTIITAMLRQNLCPACAEDLEPRPVETDGCRVCLCGAAWKSPGEVRTTA